MKILLVHNAYRQPGGEDVVFEQERQMLERAGHSVTTYHRSNLEIDQHSPLERLALAPQVIWSPRTRREVAEILAREKPQVVHIHNTFIMVSPAIYSACREARVPVVQTLHNYRLLCPAATFFRDDRLCEECLDHSLWRSVLHACYHDSHAATSVVAVMLAAHRWGNTWAKGVDCFIALSEFSRRKFLEGGMAGEKVVVKPNFVYPDPGVGDGSGGHAIFIGRLTPEKRVLTLLLAWEKLHSRIPLLIVGTGPQHVMLETYAKQAGLSGVFFLGQLPREEGIAQLKRARFLVFTSEWYENFPVTIAEAFACGVPVICSRLGAMPEIVADTRTGLHFSPGEPEDLAQKVEWAWTHPEQLAAMGKEARKEYENKYTVEKNYPMLMEIYQRAISSYEQRETDSRQN